MITKGVALSTSGNGREWYDKEKWFGSDVNFVMFYVEAFSYMEVFFEALKIYIRRREDFSEWR